MSDFTLQKSSHGGISGPLLLIIMDGIGLYRGRAEGYDANALDQANAPTIKRLIAESAISLQLQAHGTAVGLPSDDDMGNSEVGHNAMGAGRIFDQGAKLVNEAIRSGQLFSGAAWSELIGRPDSPGIALKSKSDSDTKPAVHLIGLLSDGGVHSHIEQLEAMIDECERVGVERLYLHALLDGRDVDPTSALTYIRRIDARLRQVDPDRRRYAIASGGGRMQVTMDRYEADWGMVERGWRCHVKGEPEPESQLFCCAEVAIEMLRESNPGVIDQDLPPFVMGKDGRAVGPIEDGDVVIFFNYRGDRAIEISRAFTEKGFDKFRRDPEVEVHYAGMMEYDGDLKLPPRYLVEPPTINRTVSEYLARNGIAQFAISETQKFGHVTYFWNGNNSEKFDKEGEVWCEIPSQRISFDKAPRMQADEIGERLIEELRSRRHRFLRVNFANGDMVGHTGSMPAAIEAVEAVDQNIAKILTVAAEVGATVVLTADHGNCDQMAEADKSSGAAKRNEQGQLIAKTSHTLSPVPFVVSGSEADRFEANSALEQQGLGNIAPTILTLLGFELPADYLPPLIRPR